MFYATTTDMVEVLSTLEAAQPFQYTLTGMFRERQPTTFRPFREVPELGIAAHPSAVGNNSYLMALQGEGVDSEQVPQKAGGVLFSIDQTSCPNAIFLAPGGRHGGSVILYGMIGTISTAQQSLALYKIASKHLRQKFTPVDEYWVGPDAMRAWKAGTRLTVVVQSPPTADLRARGGRDESEPD